MAMTRLDVFQSIAFKLLWWQVLYAWLVHRIDGAYNLLVAGAVLGVVVFVLMPFVKGNAAKVRPAWLNQFSLVSNLLFILVLVWFGHGWLAACSALSCLATSFWQFLCRKAAGLEA